MPKVLIIEDDQRLGSELKESLLASGFEADLVSDGSEGLHWLKEGSYAVAVVDWNLPGMSGVEICKNYRASGGKTPILMLTGNTESDAVVSGLQAGADDYVRKPGELRELLARLNSLMRRPTTYQSSEIQIGIVKIDTAKRGCWVNDVFLTMPRREFAILELLMHNPGHLYTAERIIEKAWPTGTDASPDVVRVHVTRLRQRLNAASVVAGAYLVNVYGEGYKFEKPEKEPSVASSDEAREDV
jgi:DNA-binding response OmpR family regulator